MTGSETAQSPSSFSSSSSPSSTSSRCPAGFEYNARLNQCDDVDECAAEGTNDCDAEHETCRNTVGDYICEDLPGVVVLDGHHEVSKRRGLALRVLGISKTPDILALKFDIR